MTFEDAREILHGPDNAEKFQTLCPCHNDRKTASLSVSRGASGELLMYCHGCQARFGDLLRAIKTPGYKAPPLPKQAPLGNLITAYNYPAPDGSDYLRKRRFEYIDSSGHRHKTFLWDHYEAGQWLPTSNGHKPAPYNAFKVLAAPFDVPVYAVEGEKDVDTLSAMGLLAISPCNGAQSDHTTLVPYLRDRPVFIIPDDDAPGHELAARLAASVKGARIVPPFPGFKDVSAFVEGGHSRENILEVVARAQVPVAAAQTWPKTKPLGVVNRGAFPLSVFAPWLYDMVKAVSRGVQVPEDLGACIALGVLATAGARGWRVRIKKDFTENLNLYIVACLPSGERKSPTQRMFFEPLEAYDNEWRARLAPEINRMRDMKATAEHRLKKAIEDAVKGKGAENRAQADANVAEARKELAAYDQIPPVPRLFVDNCTSEALVSLLAAHKVISMYSSEAGIFSEMAGIYKNGAANLDAFLKAHCGDTIRIDRKMREAEYVENPRLTMSLCIQPAMLEALKDVPSARGAGLLARFLFSLPPSMVGDRVADSPEIPPGILDDYCDKVTALLHAGENSEDILTFSPEAFALWVEFHTECEHLIGDAGRLNNISDWVSKLSGTMPRIAALIHLADYAGQEIPGIIHGHCVERAIDVCRYFISHAEEAFNTFDTPEDIADARYLWKYMANKKLTGFTSAEGRRFNQRRFDPVEKLFAACAVLCEHNYIRQSSSKSWEINPDAR